MPTKDQPPPKTFAEDELYVFISYARPDQMVAEKVEAFLTTAGVRVFRDTGDIRAGDNWDITIENALRECERMVLLLSSSSMPYRKEIHREWFYFDQKRKPIYPLFIEECDLHTRLLAYNYIDARRFAGRDESSAERSGARFRPAGADDLHGQDQRV